MKKVLVLIAFGLCIFSTTKATETSMSVTEICSEEVVWDECADRADRIESASCGSSTCDNDLWFIVYADCIDHG